jgi:hypothetical protein
VLQESQHEAASQQVGSQHAAASQQLGSQQLGAQQLPQPPPCPPPNIRSSSSKPKLWLHMPALTTSAPIKSFHFI